VCYTEELSITHRVINKGVCVKIFRSCNSCYSCNLLEHCLDQMQDYLEKKQTIRLLQKENKLFLERHCRLPRKRALQRIIALFNGKRVTKEQDFDYVTDAGGPCDDTYPSWELKENQENFLEQMNAISERMYYTKLYIFYHGHNRHLVSVYNEKSIEILASWIIGVQWRGISDCSDTDYFIAVTFEHRTGCYVDAAAHCCSCSTMETFGVEWSEFCKQLCEKLIMQRVLRRFMHRKLYNPPNGIRYKEALDSWEKATRKEQ
jgi:hypothetical protein